MDAPQITVSLPGVIWRWLADQDLDQVTEGMRAGEVEWRRAMPSASSRRVGRGTVHEMTVSAVAAFELAQELSQRARMERDVPRADQLIDPRDLERAAGRIGDQVIEAKHPEMAIWSNRAERLLEDALDLIRSEGDPLPAISAAETALRIEAGELSPSAMDGYSFPGEDGCTCPPGMRERGGFMSDCRACCPGSSPTL